MRIIRFNKVYMLLPPAPCWSTEEVYKKGWGHS